MQGISECKCAGISIVSEPAAQPIAITNGFIPSPAELVELHAAMEAARIEYETRRWILAEAVGSYGDRFKEINQ
jgi:hypothetical protein